MNATQENLKKALELLGPNGENWIKGAMRTWIEEDVPSFCSLGAVIEAHNGWEFKTAVQLLSIPGVVELGQACKLMATSEWVEPSNQIVEFNDSKLTMFRDIKAVFERAIEIAGEK
jgi:hypothetical protein